MRTVLPIIVYTWLAVSLVIYGRRLYRRAGGGGSSSSPDAPLPPSGAARDPSVPPAGPGNRSSTSPTVPRVPHVPHVPTPEGTSPPLPDGVAIAPPTFAADGTPHMDATHFPIEPAVAAALAEEGRLATPGVAAPSGGAPEPGRTGLFAKASVDDPAVAAVPLQTLMAGISLPCDLTPLVSLDDAHRSDAQARFVTRDHEPDEVGREVGDELERLGFDLASLSANEVMATRGDGRLVVTIHTNPHTMQVDDRRAFPTTSSGDVVVEFTSS